MGFGHYVRVWLVIGLVLTVSSSHQAHSIDYLPAWDAQCALGRDLDKGCAAVKARKVVDTRAFPWRALGRINVAGLNNRGHCTGVLVSDRHVVTAAHCLFFQSRKRWVKPGEIHFVAGARPDGFAAHAKAVKYRVSPVHDTESGEFTYRPRADWAVIELSEPIGASVGFVKWTVLDQAALGNVLDKGTQVVIAGYPGVRPHALSVDYNCGKPTYVDAGNLIAQRCATMKGDSGAPILLLHDGTATLIAVHSDGVAMENGEVIPVSVPVSIFERVLRDIMRRPGKSNQAQ